MSAPSRHPHEPRWAGVGHSAEADPAVAGAQAAAAATEGRRPALVLLFASDAYDLPALLAAVRAQTAHAPLIGCSTAGEIAARGAADAGLVVVALGGAGFSVATAAADGSGGRLREAGAQVARSFEGVEPRPHRALVLLTDGLAGDQQEVVRGAHAVLGAEVPLVGGCAGDDLKMTATYQFHGDDVLTDAVVGAAVASDAPVGIGVRHGWRRVGDPVMVTASADNRVYSLNGLPALDLYLDRLDAPEEVRTDPDAFTRFALAHPLGLDRRTGEDQVRFIGDAKFDDRSLGVIAEVPRGALAWFMEGDADSVLAATDDACHQALDGLDGHPPLALIAFDCIARRGLLGGLGVADEVARIAAAAEGAPVAGFYTYGEIARTRGATGFHNQTLVVLAVA